MKADITSMQGFADIRYTIEITIKPFDIGSARFMIEEYYMGTIKNPDRETPFQQPIYQMGTDESFSSQNQALHMTISFVCIAIGPIGRYLTAIINTRCCNSRFNPLLTFHQKP